MWLPLQSTQTDLIFIELIFKSITAHAERVFCVSSIGFRFSFECTLAHKHTLWHSLHSIVHSEWTVKIKETHMSEQGKRISWAMTINYPQKSCTQPNRPNRRTPTKNGKTFIIYFPANEWDVNATFNHTLADIGFPFDAADFYSLFLFEFFFRCT